MKYLAIVLVALVAVCYATDLPLTDEQRQHIREVGKTCIAQEGTTSEAVQQLKNGVFNTATQKEKCFVNCFLTKLGLVQDGVAQDNVVREKLGAIVGVDNINGIITKCHGQNGADNCDTAFKLYECYYQNKAVVLS